MLQGRVDQMTQVCRRLFLKDILLVLSFWNGSMFYVSSLQWTILAFSLPEHRDREIEST